MAKATQASPTVTVTGAGPGIDGGGVPVVIGVPFQAGTLRDPAKLTAHGPDGKARPTVARTLVAWPDGSTRWALVTFSATANGDHTIKTGGTKESAGVPGVRLTRDDKKGVIHLDNGVVSLNLAATGSGPIAALTALGKKIITKPGDLCFVVDDASTTHEPKRQLTILEENSLRCRVRIEGAHHRPDGSRKLNYRLDVELWAGLPGVRLDYQFFNLEPGQEYQDIGRISFECDLAMDSVRAQRHFLQVNHDIFFEPREVLNLADVAIVTDAERYAAHVENVAMLLDDVKYPDYLSPPLIETGEWLGVTDGKTHVYLQAQEITPMPPKRLFSHGHTLGLDLWPGSAGTLQLHQGRSRRHSITLTFAHGARPVTAEIEKLGAVALWEGRACVGRQWLAACGEFEQDRLLPFGQHARLERFMARTTSLIFPADMFDLGDTPDAGYSQSYLTQGEHRVQLRQGAPKIPRVFRATRHSIVPWFPQHIYEPVWVNNEYDAIHCFASELMRTGRHDLWQSLRWMVRHNIEVDFMHYSDHKWMHRTAAVHSERHTTSGAYPSHFWTQGLMEYYCLTGDPDVLEVAVALGDNIILHFHDAERGKYYTGFNREVGWAILALVHVYDMVREDRFKNEIERLVNFFVSYKPPAEDRKATGTVFQRSLVAHFYFMLNMVEAMDLYQRITGRKDLAKWLVDLLAPMPAAIRASLREGGAAYSTPAAMAIGFERTGNSDYLAAGMVCVEELVMDDARWQTPILEIKPMAVMYRAFIRFFGAAESQKMLDWLEYPSLGGRKAPRRGKTRKKPRG